jgi:predicted dehydrogenase
MPDKLKAAVIGTGMGRYHMEGYANNPNADLVAICDLNEAEAKEMAQRFGASEVYTDWEKMLTHKFDIVSVAVPNYLHAPISIAALESGANVLCEKPMATRFEDAERMVATSAKTGRYLQINMSMRYLPASRRVRQLQQQGAFGEVYWGAARLIRRKGMPRLDFDSSGTMGRGEWFVRSHLAGGGALMDIGVHTFDLMWWTMGSPKPTSVRAARFARLRSDEMQERSVSSDVDQHAAAFVSFENGTNAFFEVTWDANQPDSWNLHLFGEEMGATLGETAKLHKRDKGETSDVDVEVLKEFEETSYDHIVAAVLDPARPRVSEAKDCLEVARVLEAIRLSADQGEEVFLD